MPSAARQKFMTEEAGGKGASQQGEQALPLCRGAERNMGIKPRPYFGKLSNLLGRLSWGGVQALFQLPPCPSLPFGLRRERSVER